MPSVYEIMGKKAESGTDNGEFSKRYLIMSKSIVEAYHSSNSHEMCNEFTNVLLPHLTVSGQSNVTTTIKVTG